MSTDGQKTVLIGIDEAGLGPILGPLTISAAGFIVPNESLKDDMWQLLSDATKKTKLRLAGKMLITDSKKAYTSKAKNPKKHLEKTVLTTLAAMNQRPSTLDQLLNTLCSKCAPRLPKYKWYNDLASRPLGHNTDEIDICAQAFSRALKKNNMTIAFLKSVCLDVAHFNDMIEKVRNKSTVSFSAVCSLIHDVFHSFQNANYQFVIDRQGGRTNYTQLLRKMFPDMSLEVIKQNDKVSSYELADSDKTARIHFIVKADDKSLPTALASMTSKYLRELLMDCINEYFIGHCEDLKPTAGYFTDGKRFLEDLKTQAPNIPYDPNHLIRCR